MDTYIYQAELWCEDCARAIKARIDAEGTAPESPEDESSFDSDIYPKGPFADGGGEGDSFGRCSGCKAFLDNPLTDDGVAYEIEQLTEELYRVLRGEKAGDWARESIDALAYYSLESNEKEMLFWLGEAIAIQRGQK